MKKFVDRLLTEKTLRPFLENTFQGRGQDPFPSVGPTSVGLTAVHDVIITPNYLTYMKVR